MPRFTIEGKDVDPIEIDSDNWMSALGEALSQLGLQPEEAGGVECDVLSDGDISVRSPVGSFTIHETVETIARIRVGPATRAQAVPEPRLGSMPFDLPLTASNPLDAPDPTESPCYQARADSAEVIVQELAQRAGPAFEGLDRAGASQAALDLLMQYVPAESGAVLLAEPPDTLRFVAARGPRARQLVSQAIPAGTGIAGFSVRSGVALTVREAKKDPHHYGGVDAKTGYETRAVLTVPIRVGKRTLGCVELLNPFAGTDFATWHQQAAQLVANLLAPSVR